MLPIAALFVAGLVVILTAHWLHKWRNPKGSEKLPPGSMGLPIIGETFQFVYTEKSFNVPRFLKDRIKKYGPLFKTRLLGMNVIVSTDPDFNHFLINQEGKLVELWYPDSFNKLLGQVNETVNVQKYMRKLILVHFGRESIKQQLQKMEDMARRNLHLWSNQPAIELKDAVTTMFVEFNAKMLFSYDASTSKGNIKENFSDFLANLISFPLYIPGTSYYKCIKGKNNVLEMLMTTLKARLAYPRKRYGDMLDTIIDGLDKEGTIFTDEGIVQFIFGIMIVSFETISLALTSAIMFLTDNPSVLKQLTEEHEALLRNREKVDSAITWSEYKSMTFTSQVVNETLRIANIASTIVRRILTDIKVDGYIIPAGWLLLINPIQLHMNNDKYEDPLVFNPSRWQGQGSINGSKDFYAFGGGTRLCSGADYAKLQLSIFLHLLVTNYKWKKIKGGEVKRNLVLSYPNGFHIQISEKTKTK